jgi:hypothetical protein
VKHAVSIARRVVTLVVVAALFACTIQPDAAISPVKLNDWSGSVNLSNAGMTPFELAGPASHLGQFVANGEVEFLPIGENGSGSLIGRAGRVYGGQRRSAGWRGDLGRRPGRRRHARDPP